MFSLAVWVFYWWVAFYGIGISKENKKEKERIFKEIEEWNLSFGAKQTLYFNFYYENVNKNMLYNELYDYGEKNEKQF